MDKVRREFENIPIIIENLESSNKLYNQYYKEHGFLYYIDIDEDGNSVLLWLCRFLTLLKMIENEDTGNFQYLLEMETAVGMRQCTTDKQTVTMRRFDKLTAKGFTYNEEHTDLIIKYLLLVENDAEKIMQYTYLGFRDNHFWGYPEAGREYIGNLKLECSSEYSKNELNELLEDAPNLQFALTVGASTAVLGYLGQEMPLTTNIVHFWGDTSVGKTTALLTAISVWGKPTIESGLFSTHNQTENSLMSARLANNHSAVVALDESSLCRYDLSSMIYNISQGVNRQRLKKDTTPVSTAKWLTTVISSGESPLLEHTNQNGGLKVRCFDFHLQITKSAEHANAVKSFVLSNYGHIGREIVTNLEESEFSEIKEMFKEKRTEVLEAIPESEYLPITDRITDSYAIWLLTADFLNELGIAVQREEILQILLHHHKELGKNYNISDKIYNIILSRVASKKPLYPRRSEYFGIGNIEGLVSDGTVVIIATEFERILRENGFTDRLLCLRSLYKSGLLKKQREDTYYSKILINNVSVKAVAINIILNNKEDISL